MTRRKFAKRLMLGAATLLCGSLPFGARHSALAQSPPLPGESLVPTTNERMSMADAAKAFMSHYTVPGLSIAVGHSARLVYQDAFGWTDREMRKSLTPAHLFRIASVTKPITSVAIFTLIEQRRLSLDDRVFGHRGVLGTDYGTAYQPTVDEVTIEHLLTHTCGGWDAQRNDPMFMDVHMTHTELIAWTLRNRPLENPPGRVHAYSNFGYCLLGRVIEKLTGQPYEVFVANAVLRRCGIDDMVIGGNTLAQLRDDEVEYYGQNGEEPYGMNVRRMDSHGGWIATPADLVRFMMHVSGFEMPACILKPETIMAMTAPSAANPRYASGWAVNRANIWWHNGSLPGTEAIAVRTHSGLCWAAFANTHRPKSDMGLELDRLIWAMARKVKTWRV